MSYKPRVLLFSTKPAQPNAHTFPSTRRAPTNCTPHGTRAVVHPSGHVRQVGLPITTAVLQCACEEGVGDTRGARRDDGPNTQFPERAGVAGDSEMGTKGEPVRPFSALQLSVTTLISTWVAFAMLIVIFF